MRTYNLLIEYNNYSKTLESYGNIDNDTTDFNPCKFKSRFINNDNNTGTVNVKIAVPSKYLSNFWRTLERPLINFEMNLILTCSAHCVICEASKKTVKYYASNSVVDCPYFKEN